MRKEVVWAIIAGVVLGLIVAFGVYRIKSNITLNQTALPKINKPSPVSSPTSSEFKIVLDKPADLDVTTENSVTLTGLTKPKSFTVLTAEAGDYLTKSDESGFFSQKVVLSPGINQINIFAFEDSGRQAKSLLTIVYSSGFQEKQLNPDSASDSATTQQKVANNINKLLNRPKAYIGTVTDITDSTLEIKSRTSEIEQISLQDTQNVLNTVGSVSKQVKKTDIAIGDYIVAMGYVGPSSVLSAQRILITQAIVESKTNAISAKVDSVNKKNINATQLSDQTQVTITPAKNTDIESFKEGKLLTAKITDIKQSDLMFYVNAPNDKGELFIRSLFIVPQN